MKRLGATNGSGETIPMPIAEKNGTMEKSPGLLSIQKSGKNQPDRIVIFGPEGVGKTTFSAAANKPIFIPTEEGLRSVEVDCFPEPKTWLDLLENVETLRRENHEFKTLVIDTADATERLCHQFMLTRDKKESIEAYGFGKGYVMASETFKGLLSSLDALRKEKGMDIVMTAHSVIRTFQNPISDNYDRIEMKLDKRTGSLLKEWCDILLYAGYDVVVDTKTGQSKGKGYGGERMIYTTHAAAYDAKNRHGLPPQMAANPQEFWKLIQGGVAK